MDFKIVSKNLLVAIAGGAFALSAFAQWQWMDKDGRKVFSDRSPPPEISEKDILKRPSGSIRSAAPAIAPLAAPDASTAAKPLSTASATMAKASAPKLTGKDAELETKKKQAEDQEAAKKKAEEDRVAKAKAENCESAKRNVATLQSGVRVATVNAKGEREVFDDARRASETKQAQDIVDKSCK